MLKQEEETDGPEDYLETTTTKQKMRNGSKVLTNNPNSFQLESKIKGERLEAVKN